MLDSRILITGAQGLVKTSLIKELSWKNYKHVATYSIKKRLMKTISSMCEKNATRGYSNAEC